MKLPSRKTNFVLFVISIVLGGVGIIFQTHLIANDSLAVIGRYLSLFFILAIGFFLIICLQFKIKNRFLEALLYSGLITVGYIIITSAFYSLVYRDNFFSTFQFFFLSILAFTILCPVDGLWGWIILFIWWLLFIILLGLSLWGTKRITSKKIRLLGMILVILAFGAVFNICYRLSAGAIAAAIAIYHTMYR